jgi:hypothetical protein
MISKRIVFVLMLFLFSTSSLYSLEFAVGAKAGYYFWIPYFKEFESPGWEEIERGDGLLYGPMMSIRLLPRLSFSVVALIGEQSTEWSYREEEQYIPDPGVHINFSETGNVKLLRLDIDSAIGYSITEKMKLFIGYKYQRTDVNIKSMRRLFVVENPTNSFADYQEIDGIALNQGPALGIGYILSLGKGYFLSANLSGLYMFGYTDVGRDAWTYRIEPEVDFNNPAVEKYDSRKFDVKMFGINFEPFIGLCMTEGSPIFTLGFRYQLLRTKFDEHQDVLPTRWINDHIYGVFVSVLYMFNI